MYATDQLYHQRNSHFTSCFYGRKDCPYRRKCPEWDGVDICFAVATGQNKVFLVGLAYIHLVNEFFTIIQETIKSFEEMRDYRPKVHSLPLMYLVLGTSDLCQMI